MFIFIYVVGILLLAGKLTSLIDISWWYVILPFIVNLFVFVIAFVNDTMNGLDQ